jgi:hypothetical protein
MTRIWLAAPLALTLIAGAAVAQTSSETTTTTNTYVPVAPPVMVAPAPVQQSTVQQRTVDGNGNVMDKTITTGTAVDPYGQTTTTRRTTETTTVR